MIISDSTNSLIVCSTAGLGKTRQIIKQLNDNGTTYEYINGHTTPLAFLKKIYHNNDSLLVFDDVDELLRNRTIIGYFKGLLEEVNGKRIICNNSTSMQAQDIPQQFEFTGKIIIITNSLPARYDDSVYAMMSRCLVYEMDLSRKQRLTLIREVAKQEYRDSSQLERQRVYDYLKQRTRLELHSLNLRAFFKLLDIYLHLKRSRKLKRFRHLVDDLNLS